MTKLRLEAIWDETEVISMPERRDWKAACDRGAWRNVEWSLRAWFNQEEKLLLVRGRIANMAVNQATLATLLDVQPHDGTREQAVRLVVRRADEWRERARQWTLPEDERGEP